MSNADLSHLIKSEIIMHVIHPDKGVKISFVSSLVSLLSAVLESLAICMLLSKRPESNPWHTD